MPGTMRAVRLEMFGDPSVLKLATLPRPQPGPGEVLVRVRAAGVNPVDWKTRSGAGMARLVGELPLIPGWDVSGEVEDVGHGVTRFAAGDEVYGMIRFPRPGSAYAEYATSPSRHLARKPSGLSHTESAALPLAALTAWQVLVETAEVRPGQRVLVHAAAGGVGHLAVQVAKARGAHVIGTARSVHHAFLESLRIDEAVDYIQTRFEEAVHDVDVVVDTVGGEYTTRSLATLVPGGIVVYVAGRPPPEVSQLARRMRVRVAFMLVEPDHCVLERIAELVALGRLRPHLEAVLPLEAAARAHELGERGRTQGKIVLQVD